MHISHPQPARLVYNKAGCEEPLVTIAIPTYRRNAMLAEALISALQQDTTIALEIIVVDNDSESEAQVLASVELQSIRHSVRYYINETNLGMFGNWNQCIALARGRWMTLLHDDDWLSPAFLSVMMPIIRNGIDFAVCRVAVGTSSFNPLVLHRKRDSARIIDLTLDDLIFGTPSPAPGIIVVRQMLLDVNGFDPASFPCADYVTYAKCVSRANAVRINRTLAYYRTTDSQTFKGDTLISMIEKSNIIKLELLQKAHPASICSYILSMAYWYRLARQHGKQLNIKRDGIKLRIAYYLSRVRLATFALEGLRVVIKRLVSSKTNSKLKHQSR